MSAKEKFIEWLKVNDPAVYVVIKKRLEMERAKNGLGNADQETPSIWQTITQTIQDVAPTLVQLPFQKKLLDAQMRRAEQGLPPLNVDDYTPTLKIGTTITPENEAALTRIATETAKSGLADTLTKAAPFIGGGLLLWAVLGKKSGSI